MAKQLNKNLVVILTIGAMSVTTLAAALMIAKLPEKDPKYFVEQAEEAVKAGEHMKAARLYGRAFQVSQDPKFLVDAGKQALEAGDPDAARGSWRQALINDPKFEPAQEELVKLTLRVLSISGTPDDWRRLLDDSQKLLDINEQSSVGLQARGRAKIALRTTQPTYEAEGRADLERSRDLAPDNPEYAAALANYLMEDMGDAMAATTDEAARKEIQDKAVQAADAVYDKLLKTAPNDPKTYYNYGVYLAGRQRFDESLAALNKAAELAPNDADTYVMLGRYWTVRSAVERAKATTAAPATTRPQTMPDDYFAKAEAALRKAIECDKNLYDSYLQLGNLYQSQGDRQKELETYDARLSRAVVRASFLPMLDRYQRVQLLSQAFQSAMAQVTDRPEDAARDKELIEKARGYYKSAVAEAEQQEEDPRVLLMKARLAVVDNDIRTAVKDLERAHQSYSTRNIKDTEVKFMLARLQARMGDTGAAEAMMTSVLSDMPWNQEVWAYVAELRGLNHKNAEAVQAAQESLRLCKSAGMKPNETALRTLLNVYRQNRDWDQVRRIEEQLGLGKAQTAEELMLRANLTLVRAESESGQADPALLAAAEKDLREILSKDPVHLDALRRLVRVLAYQKRYDDVKQVLDAAQAAAQRPEYADRKSLPRALELIRISAAPPDPSKTPKQQAEARFEAIKELIDQGQDEFAKQIDYVQLYMGNSDYAQALEHAQKANELKPDEPSVLDIILRLALQKNDFELARRMADRAVATDADGAKGQSYEGRYWLAKGDSTKAIEAFRSWIDRTGNHSDGFAWLGKAYVVARRFDEARQAFEKAVDLNPNNADAQVNLAQLADRQNQLTADDPHLLAAARLVPRQPWVRQKMEDFEEKRSPDAAIARREAIRQNLPTDPEAISTDDITNLVRLGDLYARTNAPDKAEAVLKEAVEKNEAAPAAERIATAPWAYAKFLREKRPPDPETGATVLQHYLDGLRRKPKKAEAQLMIARHLREWARLNLPKAPTKEDVDKAYDAVLAISSDIDMLLEVGTHYLQSGDFKKAEDLYRQALAKAEQPDAASRAAQIVRRLLIDGMIRSRDATRKEEIDKAIADYKTRYPDDATGWLMEGVQDAGTGREEQAIAALSEHVKRDPTSAIGFYRRGVLYCMRSRWNEGIADLQRAKALEPSAWDYQHRLLLARAYRQRKDAAAQIAELESILDDDPNNETVGRVLVQAYAEQDKLAQAETRASQFAARSPKNPGWPLLLAQLAEKHQQRDPVRILGFYRKAAELSDYDPDIVWRMLTVMVQSGRSDDAIDYVTRTLPADKRTPQLVAMLGNAYAAKGDSAKALQEYTRALDAARDSLALSWQIADRIRAMRGAPVAMQIVQDRLDQSKSDAAAQFCVARLRLSAALSNSASTPQDFDAPTGMLLDVLPSAKTPEDKLQVLQALAMSEQAQKRFSDAEKHYIELLKITPRNAIALNNLAFMLMTDMNRPQDALQYSRLAADIGAGNVSVLDTYGWNLSLLGRYEEALSWLNDAWQADADVPLVRYHIAATRAKLAGTLTAADKKEEQLKLARDEVAEAYRLSLAAKDEDAANQCRALMKELGVDLESK